MTNGLTTKGLTKASKPYQPLTNSMFRTESLFDELFINPFISEKSTRTSGANIVKHEDRYEAEVDMPGLQKSDIDIELQDNTIHIRGERDVDNESGYRKRKYSQKIFVSDEIDVDNIGATYEGGVLTVNLPLKETVVNSGNTRKIDIS